MIVRRWRAVAHDERGYVVHFRRRVLPGLRRLRGFRSALLLRERTHTTLAEIEVLTFWSSMRPIRRFTSHNTERAVVEEEAKPLLESFERRVRHFEVVLECRRR